MGSITAITLAPSPNGTGQTSAHLIHFTTASTLPNDGKLVFTYPAGFNVAAATATSASIDGGFTVSVLGQVVTVTRDATGTATPAGPLDVTLHGIVNATLIVSYSITMKTTNSANVTIDGPNTSATFQLAGGPLTAVSDVPTSTATGVTTTHTVHFTTQSTLPVDGKVAITFPAGFNVAGAGATSGTIDGGFTVAVVGQVVTVTRDGTGTNTAPGALTLALSGIVNAVTVGSYTVSIATENSISTVLDGPTTSSSFSLVGGPLTAVSDTPTSARPGVLTHHALAFTTESTLPIDGKIAVTFPAGFNVAGAAVFASSLDGGFTVGVVGQTVTVTRDGSGTASAPGAKTLTLSGIVNALTVGSYTVSITTKSNSGSTIDGPTTSSAFSLAGGTVESITAIPTPAGFSQTANYTIGFTPESELPLDGKVVVTFPAGFNVAGAAFVGASFDGGASVGVAGQAVTITRDGTGTNTAPGPLSLALSGIVNPAAAGGYTLTVATKTSGGAAIDAAGTSSFFAITGSTLAGVTSAPLDSSPRALTSYVIAFTTTVTWPRNGKLAIQFPAKFDVALARGAPAVATLDGGLITTVDPSTGVITLSRDGSGSDLAPGTYSVRVSNIKNPSPVNRYTLVGLATLDSTGSQLDAALALPSWMVGNFPPLHSRLLARNEWEMFKVNHFFDPTQLVITNAYGATNRFKVFAGPDADHVLADPNTTALTGTVTLANGSKSVVGVATSFLTQAPAGTVVQLANGLVLGVVASVADDTHLTLVDPWAGVNIAGATLFNATPQIYTLAPHQSMIFTMPIGGAAPRLFTEVFALDGPVLFTLEGPDGILSVVRNSTTERQL